MRECIGDHPYLSVVKLGLAFAGISKRGDAERIGRIKREVTNRYGLKGVRILAMGSTGVLLEVIRYMSDIKIKHDYTQADMVERFEKIIEAWMVITIFHKAEDGESALRKQIIEYMQSTRELFFVFASGIAGDQAKRMIAMLNNESEIRKRRFTCSLLARNEDQTGRELYTWVFERF